MVLEHTAIWGKSLVDELKKRGFDSGHIAGNTGIRLWVLDQEEPKLSFDQLALLFERAAELTDDDLIGFRHGQNRDYRRGGLIAYVGLSSPTVGSLLQNMARYQRISSDVIEIDTSQLEDGVLAWHFRAPRAIARQQYVEFGAAGIVDILRRLTNRNLHPERVDFRHHRSKSLEAIGKYFGCPVTFGADENRVVLKKRDLDLPLNTTDDHLYRMLLKYCEEAIGKTNSTEPSLVTSIEEAIAQNATVNQADVAKTLGLSVRTMSRRLSTEGTSYKDVLEAYREAMAKSMINGSEMSVTEIAYVLGYADLSSFSTAFRRWTGKTPTEYRDQ